jgi:hypothetical protein
VQRTGLEANQDFVAEVVGRRVEGGDVDVLVGGGADRTGRGRGMEGAVEEEGGEGRSHVSGRELVLASSPGALT